MRQSQLANWVTGQIALLAQNLANMSFWPVSQSGQL